MLSPLKLKVLFMMIIDRVDLGDILLIIMICISHMWKVVLGCIYHYNL